MPQLKYTETLAALGDVRDFALMKFRKAGGKRDRWARVDREAMADALTRAEDFVENQSPKNKALRESLKQTRRRLELELWP